MTDHSECERRIQEARNWADLWRARAVRMLFFATVAIILAITGWLGRL